MRATTVLAMLALCGCSGEFSSDSNHIDSATELYDTERLRRSLESIKTWHVVNETGIGTALRPGLPKTALDPELLTSECRLTKELKMLWSWHDGEQTQIPFIWYHDFLPLEDAVSEYQWLRLNPLVRWDPKYIPIMSFEGEWYGAYCGESSNVAGPIIHYSLEDGGRVMAANLTTFIATMAEAFESGAVKWIDGGMVEDIQKVREIHHENNPGFEFPYYVPDGA